MTESDPRETRRLTRRDLMKVAAIGAVGLAAGYGGAAALTRLGAERQGPFRFLTGSEAKLLTEICEQIIPRDDLPGATDAGVVYYLDRQLAGSLRVHRQAYRAGLESLRRTCAQLHGLTFEELAPDRKVSFLQALEAGRVPKEHWGSPTAQEFFRVVSTHTMHGFYGSPRHGGNRDYLSYRMLGIPYPQVIGRNL